MKTDDAGVTPDSVSSSAPTTRMLRFNDREGAAESASPPAGAIAVNADGESEDTQSQPAQKREHDQEGNPTRELRGILVMEAAVDQVAHSRRRGGGEHYSGGDHQKDAKEVKPGGATMPYPAMAKTREQPSV